MILGQFFPHITVFAARLVQPDATDVSCANCAHAASCDQPPSDVVCEERLLRLGAAEQHRVCEEAHRRALAR